jgi:hypothetical protein
MTEEQIKNLIALCKNQPVSKVLALFRFWGPNAVKAMAKYFNCDENPTTIASRLILGR